MPPDFLRSALVLSSLRSSALRAAAPLGVLFVLATLPACGVRDISSHYADASVDGTVPALCAPTGRSLIDTGVYIAPEACTDVTLYALDATPTNDAWVLHVAWPMYGQYHALELTNQTTGDVEREILYTGDPEFTLFSGNYVLGGYEMAAGDNTIDYLVYDTTEPTPGTYERTIVRQGSFVLHVTLSASTGG